MRRIQNIAKSTICVLMAAGTLEGAITPYTVDANTTHLYHFDEQSATTTTADAVTGPGAIPLTLSGGSINNLSYQSDGFTNANSPPGAPLTTAGRITPTSNNGRIFNGGSQTAASLGIGNAFTIDAVIQIPQTSFSSTTAIQITSTSTLYQFRIVNGVLGFLRSTPSNEATTAVIPTTGDNAYDPNSFYHVAITYNGLAATADNAKLYWTKLTDTTTTANPIGSDQLDGDLSSTVNAVFGVANRGTTVSEELGGTIDELRFSNVARTADQFIFSVPEPTSLALLAFGGLIALRRQR